jgi:hypothetical protein
MGKLSFSMVRKEFFLKKILTLLLCIAMLCAFGIKSFAAKNNSETLNKVIWLQANRHAPVELVKGGKPSAVIVIADSMSDKDALGSSIKPAAKYVQRYIKQLTGVELPIVSERDKSAHQNRNLIVIGSCSLAAEAGVSLEKLPYEGFIVKTFPQGVAIAGIDDKRYSKGTLWGAMDFVERYLGFRFYYPGIGTYVPPQKSALVLQPFAYKDYPRHPFRWDWTMKYGLDDKNWPWDKSKYPYDLSEMWDRYRYQRQFDPYLPLGLHGCYSWPAKYEKTRPQVFVKDKYGVRHIGANNPAYDSWVDVSSPLTLQTFMEEVRQGLNLDDYGRVVRFGLMDIQYELPDNPLYNKPEVAGPAGTMSDIQADFYIRLCEAVKKEYPDKIVAAFFYNNYCAPPLRIKEMLDNFQATICNRVSPASSKEQLQTAVERMAKWNKILKRKPLLWDYGPGTGGYPNYYFNNMRYYYSAVMSQSNGAFHDGYHGDWNKDHLISYVIARMDWNPDFNIEAAIDEYTRLMYGNAAKPIGKLCALLTKRWDYAPSCSKLEDYYDKMYPPEVVAQIRTLLDEAKGSVSEGSIEKQRLDFLLSGFDRFFSDAKAIHSRKKVQMSAIRRTGEIAIDAAPDDSGWQHCDKATMRIARTAESSKYLTICRATYDDNALYLLFQMKDDKADKLVTSIKTRDGSVFVDDSVEIMLIPGAGAKNYYHLIVNPIGTIYTAKHAVGGPKEVWPAGGVNCMSSVQKDGWILEAKIPWNDLETLAPKVGDAWQVNFVRNKMTAPQESQSVSATMGNNHNVDNWGTLKFESAY